MIFDDPVHKALQDYEWADTLPEVAEQGVEIIGEWEWTKKAAQTIVDIRNAKSIARVQQIVYNTYLSGLGYRVLNIS